MLTLEDAHLLPKQQDFKVFLVIRARRDGNEVEQEREDASTDEVDHAGTAAWIVPTDRYAGDNPTQAEDVVNTLLHPQMGFPHPRILCLTGSWVVVRSVRTRRR